MPSQIYAVYKAITRVKKILNCLEGFWQQGVMHAINIEQIHSIVGIWTGKKKSVWILRKHPAWSLINSDEISIDDDKEEA